MLARTCPRGLNADENGLERNIIVFQADRNEAGVTVNRRFSAIDDKAEMLRLYPDALVLTDY